MIDPKLLTVEDVGRNVIYESGGIAEVGKDGAFGFFSVATVNLGSAATVDVVALAGAGSDHRLAVSKQPQQQLTAAVNQSHSGLGPLLDLLEVEAGREETVATGENHGLGLVTGAREAIVDGVDHRVAECVGLAVVEMEKCDVVLQRVVDHRSFPLRNR